MKLYCLSVNPNKPCYVLSFKGILILLDCGLDMSSILNFLPLPLVTSTKFRNLLNFVVRDCTEPKVEGDLKESAGKVFIDSTPEFILPLKGLVNFAEIDVILLSNYTCMLALPYITEETGFKGVVYATEPTKQIGKLFFEELIEFVERSPKQREAKCWKDWLHILPSPLKESVRPKTWREIYNLKTVLASLNRIQTVWYNEKIDVFGMLTVMPVSSGFCLGSSNWIISSENEQIAYINGSSTLTTHPRLIDQTFLRNLDAIILSGLTQSPTNIPDTMLGEICGNVSVTLRNNGSVLIPCYPSGIVYDLFECLSNHMDTCNLNHIPMFFISPMAEISLAYSNILAEWLSQGKQGKVYIPEEPFPHAFLTRNGRLKHFPNLHAEGFSNEFRQPCVLFCGHPSLRFGDTVHFVELWGSNALNTIIFTEPDFPHLEALSPYQPLAMKAVFCPIDTSLNFSQANKLIRDLKPRHLVLPKQYTQPPTKFPHRTDLVIEAESIPFTFGEVRPIPIHRQSERIQMDPQLASSLIPLEVKPGVSLATVTGNIQVRDNKYILMKSTVERKQKPAQKQPDYHTWGQLDIDEFVKQLAKERVNDVKVEETPGGHIIHLDNEDTLIQIDDNTTHILCQGDQEFRKKLRDIVVKCLNKI